MPFLVPVFVAPVFVAVSTVGVLFVSSVVSAQDAAAENNAAENNVAQDTAEQTDVSASKQRAPIWPALAPGETSNDLGVELPPVPNVSPPITRLSKVRRPMMNVYPSDNPNGTAVLILPGGGFNFVVPDLEGSEAAVILNRLGITAFVLNYRTKRDAKDAGWQQALQDAQRAMKYVRANAKRWEIDSSKIGLLGFSAGGQVAARLLTDKGNLAYEAVDELDQQSHRPDFAILIYPWNMYDSDADSLIPEIKVTASIPPTFLVHTHDDRSSSMGSALFYVALKKAGVPAEIHVYQNGGHGYGVRSRPHSDIGSWSDRMSDWLRQLKIASH